MTFKIYFFRKFYVKSSVAELHLKKYFITVVYFLYSINICISESLNGQLWVHFGDSDHMI